MQEKQNTEAYIQNMIDAGCDNTQVECFCECLKQKNQKEELCILEKHRADLLDEIHHIQSSIEELDRVRKQIKNGSPL